MAVCLAAVAFTGIAYEPPAHAILPPMPSPAPVEQSGPSGPTTTIIAEAELGQQDSTCNYEVRPYGFGILGEDDVQIELTVPNGVTIAGWSCSAELCVNRVTAEQVAEYGHVWLPMEIDNGDPNRTGGGWIFVAEGDPDGEERGCLPKITGIGPDIIVCDDGFDPYAYDRISDPSTCCACPCDFAPSCG
jgi:hypothetical protein